MNTISNTEYKKCEKPIGFSQNFYTLSQVQVDLQFIVRGDDKLQINLAGLIVDQINVVYYLLCTSWTRSILPVYMYLSLWRPRHICCSYPQVYENCDLVRIL